MQGSQWPNGTLAYPPRPQVLAQASMLLDACQDILNLMRTEMAPERPD
jgi:hypothetical protein